MVFAAYIEQWILPNISLALVRDLFPTRWRRKVLASAMTNNLGRPAAAEGGGRQMRPEGRKRREDAASSSFQVEAIVLRRCNYYSY